MWVEFTLVRTITYSGEVPDGDIEDLLAKHAPGDGSPLDRVDTMDDALPLFEALILTGLDADTQEVEVYEDLCDWADEEPDTE